MSYIEKEKLIKADIASIENKVRHAFNQGYDLGYKEGKSNLVLSDISLDTYKQVVNQRDKAIDELFEILSELNKIKLIVKEWNNDTYSDYISYDCMIKITAIIDEIESEKINNDDENIK